MAKQSGGPHGFQLVGDPESPGGSETGEALPTGTFATFLLSLSTSALMHMGVPPGGEDTTAVEAAVDVEVDLVLARQTIDILEMLREKTSGNLDADEQRLFDAILYDLRMRFVKAREP